MPELSKIYLFRMTHIQNIPHILSNGITHSSSPNSNPAFVPIGNASLISSRDLFVMPNGNRLGDYIPFYFGVRMPMLYVIQNGFTGVAATNAQDIVYCVCNVQQIVNHKLDFVFTDGHAVNTFSSFYDPSDVKRIGSIIDRKAIDSKYWNDEKDLDLKRRKEAEFLVAEDIPVTAIDGYAVYNATAQNRLISFGISKSDIEIFSEFYF
jgi:hypothetical protein